MDCVITRVLRLVRKQVVLLVIVAVVLPLLSLLSACVATRVRSSLVAVLLFFIVALSFMLIESGITHAVSEFPYRMFLSEMSCAREREKVAMNVFPCEPASP